MFALGAQPRFSSFRFDGVLGLGLPSLSQTLEFNFLEARAGSPVWCGRGFAGRRAGYVDVGALGPGSES